MKVWRKLEKKMFLVEKNKMKWMKMKKKMCDYKIFIMRIGKKVRRRKIKFRLKLGVLNSILVCYKWNKEWMKFLKISLVWILFHSFYMNLF